MEIEDLCSVKIEGMISMQIQNDYITCIQVNAKHRKPATAFTQISLWLAQIIPAKSGKLSCLLKSCTQYFSAIVNISLCYGLYPQAHKARNCSRMDSCSINHMQTGRCTTGQETSNAHWIQWYVLANGGQTFWQACHKLTLHSPQVPLWSSDPIFLHDLLFCFVTPPS